jgi:hypothetical protein
MFDDSKTILSLAYRPRMVKGGSEVKKDHGGREDNRADNESGIPMAHRMNDEKWRSDKRTGQPYAVADTVGDLFALGLHLLSV